MQVMVTKWVQKTKPAEVETSTKDDNGKAVDRHEKPSYSNWDEQDVLLRTWISRTMIEESYMLNSQEDVRMLLEEAYL